MELFVIGDISLSGRAGHRVVTHIGRSRNLASLFRYVFVLLDGLENLSSMVLVHAEQHRVLQVLRVVEVPVDDRRDVDVLDSRAVLQCMKTGDGGGHLDGAEYERQ